MFSQVDILGGLVEDIKAIVASPKNEMVRLFLSKMNVETCQLKI